MYMSRGHRVVLVGGATRAVPGWVLPGYGTWVGTGRGNTGTQHGARKEVPRQRSGPRKGLQGPGVGGLGAGCVRAC